MPDTVTVEDPTGEGPPVEIYVCHCSECRGQSASAFGISVIVPNDKLRLTEGTLSKWTRPSDTGGTLDCFFCSVCGTRVWHGNPETDARISVKGGSLDDTRWLHPVAHIWLRSAQPWVRIDPAEYACFPQEPDDEAALEQRWLEQLRDESR